MNETQKAEASKLWNDNWTAQKIADHFGLTLHQVEHAIIYNRDLFPYRTDRKTVRKIEPNGSVRSGKFIRWQTEFGAIVTLPAVNFFGVVMKRG